MIYSVLIICPVILNFVCDRFSTKKKNRIIIGIYFLLLFLLIAMRGESVGNDTPVYLEHYRNISKESWTSLISKGREVGYGFLQKILYSLGISEQGFLAIAAAISLYPIYRLYRDETENPLQTVLLFQILPIFGMMFTGIRQGIAMGISAAAFKCLKNKKNFKFILLIFLASLFHSSAWFCLLIYPIYHSKITLKKVLIFIPIVPIVYMNSTTIVSFLMQYVDDFYADRYGESVFNNGAYMMLILFVLFLIYCFVVPKKEKTREDFYKLRNITLLIVFVQSLVPALQVMMRINYYYLIYLPVITSNVKANSETNKKIATIADFIMCLFFGAYFLWNVFTQKSSFELFPYIPFWA